MSTQPIVVGDTVDFRLLASKNGTAWDMTGGAVSLYLQRPDGTVLGPFAATISTSQADYTADVTNVDVPGGWTRQWKVSVAGVVMRSRPIAFDVYGQLG